MKLEDCHPLCIPGTTTNQEHHTVQIFLGEEVERRDSRNAIQQTQSDREETT